MVNQWGLLAKGNEDSPMPQQNLAWGLGVVRGGKKYKAYYRECANSKIFSQIVSPGFGKFQKSI